MGSEDTSNTTSPTTQAQVTMYLNLFSYLMCESKTSYLERSLMKPCRDLLGHRTDQITTPPLLNETNVNRGSLEKVCWWEIVRRRPMATTKDHMISSYDVLIIQFDESNANVLERFYTSAGNPVKEILLKLNLPDHRILKDGSEVKEFQRSFRHSDTERLSRSDEVLKLKNFKKDATLKLSKSTNQEWYEHVGPEVTRSQDDKCMSTRSNSSNLFSPLRDPESLIRRRNLGEPSSLFDFKEVMSIPHNNMGPPPAGAPPPNNNGQPPVVRPNGQDPRSMEELCQPSIDGRGGPIAPILIQAMDFGLHHHMIQQV
ncbi:hypothetical protein Tco_0778757 [Tanacetum coccineum]